MTYHSARDELVYTLTHKVRVLTVAQIARTWFGHTKHPTRNAKGVLRRLRAAGLVTSFEAMAHPEIEITRPLLDWHPGSRTQPAFERISYAAKKRRSQTPVRTTIATATKMANRLTGGTAGARPIRRDETSHDIHVATLFLSILRNNRDLAKSWVHESTILAEHEGHTGNIPDAIIRDSSQSTAIEVVGSYSAAKLAAIHEGHKLRHYQLW